MRDARTRNIREAEQAGVDWMGFICYPRSPRFVARRPRLSATGSVRRIGVFVNARQEEIMRRADELGLHGIQLHGSETPELCRHIQATGLQVIKRCRKLDERTRLHGSLCRLLRLFSVRHAQSKPRRFGRTFDWQLLDEYQGRVSFLLSGGLTPASLPDLLRFHHPRWAGIDLNSGFETAPAVKNCTVLSTFIHELKEQKL